MPQARCVLFVFVSILVGCGPKEDRVPVHNVTGMATYNGAPMRGASVALIPVTPDPKVKVPPFGEVGENGSFHITTYGGADGAPAGEYRVTLTWSDGDPDSPSDLCKGRYSNPSRPIATVIVGEGDNELPLIDLKGPPIKVPSN